MPYRTYVEHKFSKSNLELIDKCNVILTRLRSQGYEITLRQLYYQCVSQNIIKNKQSEYDRLGSLINDARLAGLVDWNAIIDRTRNVMDLAKYSSPGQLVRQYANRFYMDRWVNQEYRPQVWVEKEALFGVIERPAIAYGVPHFACRGYVSASEMWAIAMGMVKEVRAGYTPVIIHLGDHDPSGIDMSRDILDRIKLFVERETGEDMGNCIERIALNYDQVEEYSPPPNPTKLTDSRAGPYIERYGGSSWELDALEPSVIHTLVSDKLDEYITDTVAWDESYEEISRGRELLNRAASRWSELEDYLDEEGDRDERDTDTEE